MRKVFGAFILFSIALLTSCKSSKNIASGNSTALTKLSSRKVVKKHTAADFNGNTIDAKLRVNYKDNKENIGFSVKMKIKKDEVIWLKGTKLITVFKAKITPEKVSFYSPYKRNYFEGDFSMLKELLGFDVNFNQLQNMLLGQAVLNLKETKQKVEISDTNYQMYPKNQPDLFDIFYHVNPVHFKLEKQYLINEIKAQRLDINYGNYITKQDLLFPEKISIQAKENTKFTKIDIGVRSITFNSDLQMPFKIPSGYKEIKL